MVYAIVLDVVGFPKCPKVGAFENGGFGFIQIHQMLGAFGKLGEGDPVLREVIASMRPLQELPDLSAGYLLGGVIPNLRTCSKAADKVTDFGDPSIALWTRPRTPANDLMARGVRKHRTGVVLG